ncbi:MAG: hypothetical protein JWO69_1161 [Thermoleophilia bacterium]|nr:hypothetical protein [Thermoleophilia bacterium]
MEVSHSNAAVYLGTAVLAGVGVGGSMGAGTFAVEPVARRLGEAREAFAEGRASAMEAPRHAEAASMLRHVAHDAEGMRRFRPARLTEANFPTLRAYPEAASTWRTQSMARQAKSAREGIDILLNGAEKHSTAAATHSRAAELAPRLGGLKLAGAAGIAAGALAAVSAGVVGTALIVKTINEAAT